MAQCVALACAASHDGATIIVHYDCEAAAGVVSGWFSATTFQPPVQEAMALGVIAKCRRTMVKQQHVRAHTGEAFNELADVLAKSAASSVCLAAPDLMGITQLIKDSRLSHMWWCVSDFPTQGVIPALDEHCCTLPQRPCPFLQQ